MNIHSTSSLVTITLYVYRGTDVYSSTELRKSQQVQYCTVLERAFLSKVVVVHVIAAAARGARQFFADKIKLFSAIGRGAYNHIVHILVERKFQRK